MKVCDGLWNRRTVTWVPAGWLVATRAQRMRAGTLMWRRKAPPLNTSPAHRATVLVALAGMGGRPVKSNAGNAMKLPPPATAFMAPARSAAVKISDALSRLSSGIGKPGTRPLALQSLCDISAGLWRGLRQEREARGSQKTQKMGRELSP